VDSLEGSNLVASEILPDKREDLWWEWPHMMGTTVHQIWSFIA